MCGGHLFQRLELTASYIPGLRSQTPRVHFYCLACENKEFVVRNAALFLTLDNILSCVKLSICQCFNHQTGSVWVTLVFKQFLWQARRHSNCPAFKDTISICGEPFKWSAGPSERTAGEPPRRTELSRCGEGKKWSASALWIAGRSTKLWQHWLTWQWMQHYIYH